MTTQQTFTPATTPRPEVLRPGGYFVTLNGQEYRSVVWRNGNAVVQVRPGQTPPGPGFETDPSGWSKKLYPKRKLGRVFYRDTFVVWRGNWWFVPKILPDRFTLDCKLHSGNTSVIELRKDPHTWEGDDQFDFWARLTLDDIDTLVINETEIHNGRKDESTTRRIYTWNKPATKGPETT